MIKLVDDKVPSVQYFLALGLPSSQSCTTPVFPSQVAQIECQVFSLYSYSKKDAEESLTNSWNRFAVSSLKIRKALNKELEDMEKRPWPLLRSVKDL